MKDMVKGQHSVLEGRKENKNAWRERERNVCACKRERGGYKKMRVVKEKGQMR